MANIKIALEKTLANEGGYVNDINDPGGETYKGIARNMWPKWDGWILIDSYKTNSLFPSILDRDNILQDKIQFFYQVNFWQKLNALVITNQDVANSIFDFAVNSGVSTSATLAQLVVGANPDGLLGAESIKAINAFDPDHFLSALTVAKIARYIAIIKKRPTSQKYLYGWIRRTLND